MLTINIRNNICFKLGHHMGTGPTVLMMAFIAGLCASCIDPVDLNVTPKTPSLVVEGLIHDQPGPYRVKLYRANDLSDPSPEIGANLEVMDDRGNRFEFSEDQPGSYLSSGFQGEIGRAYTLLFSTADGRRYRSGTQQLLSVTTQDSVYLKKNQKSVISELGNIITIDGFNILVDTRSANRNPSYYRWDYRGVFILETQDPCALGCPGICFVLDKPDEFLRVFGTTESGIPINAIDLGFFTGSIEFETSYRIFIRQYSLTQEAFNYWKAVEAQRENTGTIFDPPPSILVGNIINEDDPDEEVLGLFQVSGANDKTLQISRLDITALEIPFPNNFSACSPGPNDPPPPGYCINCLAFPDSFRDFPEEIWP